MTTAEAEEAAFLAHLRARPDDHELRQVYADWLLEQGRATEAEVIELEAAIAEDEQARGRLGARLRILAGTLPFAWRAIVTRPRIWGCAFAEKCPRTWDRLAPRADAPTLRDCAACDRPVALYSDSASARAEVEAGHPAVVDVVKAFRTRLPPLTWATTTGDPLFGLAFFAANEPPRTAGDVLRSLGVPEPLPEPPLRNGQRWIARAGAGRVRSVYVRVPWQGTDLDDAPLPVLEALTRQPLEVRLVLEADVHEVEAWLRARNGAPRVLAYHRVYGAWTVRARDGQTCLSWHAGLPRWALPQANVEVTLRFLRELRALRASGADMATLEAFVTQPPPGAGIVVDELGPVFYVWLVPTLDARLVVDALDLPDAHASRDPFNARIWTVYTRAPRRHWNGDVSVDDAPASACRDGVVVLDEVPLDGSVHVDRVALYTRV